MADEAIGDRRTELPPVLCPVPLLDAPKVLGVSSVADLVGKRVVFRSITRGLFFYDVRLVAPPHRYHGAQVVGVLPEVDWYRQQRDDTYLAVPRPVPVAQVWFEVCEKRDAEDEPIPLPQEDILPRDRSAHLVPGPDVPPVRWPRNCGRVPGGVTGARCWIGGHPGFRIGGEPFKATVSGVDLSRGLEGLDKPFYAPVVRVLAEADWYRLLDTGADKPDDGIQVYQVEAQLVWLE